MTTRTADEIWEAQSELAIRLAQTFREWGDREGYPFSEMIVAHALVLSARSAGAHEGSALLPPGVTLDGAPGMRQALTDTRDLLRIALTDLDAILERTN